MIFVDTTFLIALAFEHDKWHKQAVKIAEEIRSSERGLSNFVIAETINNIGKIAGFEAGKIVYNNIIDNYIIFPENRALYTDAIVTFGKYNGKISFSDAISIEIMKKFNITKIVSFDSSFDEVGDIERIH